MKIAVTTDHAGFEALGELKVFLKSLGHECVDFGPKALDMDDDYPDFMFPAAKAVANGECEAGIILGGSGQGEAMAANRVKGVRCALFYGPVVARVAIDAEGNMSDDPYEILKLSRRHNHANVLSLSSRFLGLDEMKKAIETWLAASYDGAERHDRRVRKLDELI
jgi:ribose 5-phosphate isomerase B